MDGGHGLLGFCLANYRLRSVFDWIKEESVVVVLKLW